MAADQPVRRRDDPWETAGCQRGGSAALVCACSCDFGRSFKSGVQGVLTRRLRGWGFWTANSSNSNSLHWSMNSMLGILAYGYLGKSLATVGLPFYS